MADISQRPYSKNYSGLINQSVIASVVALICFSSYERMTRKRRGKVSRHVKDGIGSRETWQFGYLFQGRSWAAYPSPPVSKWLLGWVYDSYTFPMEQFADLRGIDATLYIRFMRGILQWIFLQTCSTLLILFPIHIQFSEDSVSPYSMTRASISSLVLTAKGRSLLWIHICLLIWITLSWMAMLLWIAQGAFKLRARQIAKLANLHHSPPVNSQIQGTLSPQSSPNIPYYPHPHPQYSFQESPTYVPERSAPGLRLRTVMVSNVPGSLRSEKELTEYFQYYLSRPIDKPAINLTSASIPGPINKAAAWIVNRAKHLKSRIRQMPEVSLLLEQKQARKDGEANPELVPKISRVVVVRKMTELASLLSRREVVLRNLETAHINLAKRVMLAVNIEVKKRQEAQPDSIQPSAACRNTQTHLNDLKEGREKHDEKDLEQGDAGKSHDESTRAQMDLLVDSLAHFLAEFDMPPPSKPIKGRFGDFFGKKTSIDVDLHKPSSSISENSNSDDHHTIWEALHSLPRSHLDAYQPLIHLSHLFRGRTVPAIDYYTAKLGLITSLITAERAKSASDFETAPTAFVTFDDPADAQRAITYLAVHPKNPLVCVVTLAPAYHDLDWIRLMKSVFKAEFLRDWVVNVAVWAFTVLWIFPVSLLVTLVSIQSISQYFPQLRAYLDQHAFAEEVIQSFVPTLLVSLLALLIPLILLLIAKKGQTITTLSAMHDRIMTRYYKFLIVNVLVFFCVGAAAVSSTLSVFKNGNVPILDLVANTFPIAGPFYVGWFIFTTAIHGCVELALFGLPLILYPSTKRQVTPRKRTIGTRPRTFNFYYWLPNHLLVLHILLLFSILNPLVIPFGLIYFCVQVAVVKNQLLHVYAKIYEGDGRTLLIRMIRYSLDGLMLSQSVFLAYMAVLRKSANVGVAACLILFTAVIKLLLTRMCRAQYAADDIAEAHAICGTGNIEGLTSPATPIEDPPSSTVDRKLSSRFRTIRLPAWVNFSYRRPLHERPRSRPRNPFQPVSVQTLTTGVIDGLPAGSRYDNTQNSTENNCSGSKREHYQQGPQPPSALDDTDVPPLVIRRPPLLPWDDMPQIDLPYDNPYYSRSIQDILWLPVDPVGLLDLDRTINLTRALTSAPGSCNLGTWHAGSELPESPILGTTISGTPAEQGISVALVGRKQYSGDEEIELPHGIAMRVNDIDQEDDVESTERRPSLFKRQSSRSSVNSRAHRDDSIRPSVGHQPFSGFSQNSRHRPAYSSGRSNSQSPRIDRTARRGSLLSNNESQIEAKQNVVSSNEAVISEVIVEETLAAEERKKEGARKSSSWLSSWSKGQREV